MIDILRKIQVKYLREMYFGRFTGETEGVRKTKEKKRRRERERKRETSE